MTVESPRMIGGLAKPMLRPAAFRRGLVIGPLSAPESDNDFKRKHAQLLDRAVALGVTDVQLIVRWLQVDYTATEIAPFDSVHDELLSWLVDQAKRRKLRVLLTPRLEVENEGPHSGGAIKPDNWESWWWSYRRVALHYARLGAMRKVAALSLGSELSSTEAQSDRWRKLIKEARKIYKGQLTYLAAPENVEKVGFWEALDFVGIALDQAQPRNEEQLTDKLASLTRKLGRSSKLHELGYVLAETGCGHGDPDPARELLCQYALFQGLRDEPRLEGVFLLPSVNLLQGPKSAPQAASQVVAHWYQESRN
ncbi:MAG: hypothetical protein JWN04_6840 [Myxococcaceae bacterium]|nr:hypothetical protein [Myxococcaceae bacterium]